MLVKKMLGLLSEDHPIRPRSHDSVVRAAREAEEARASTD